MYLLFICNNFDAGSIHYEGNWKKWALKSRLFWILKWQQAKRVPFGPKKVEISGATPFNGLSIGFALIKIIKSKHHIKNR
jgi:hypothetical protein